MNEYIVPQSSPSIDEDEIRAVENVMRSKSISSGDVTRNFENLFADYIGADSAIAVNSCASALLVALLAHDVRGEVIVPTLTFTASANAILAAGAKPVFADVELDSLNIDVDHVESLINAKTEAIMVVHFAGHPCNMEGIEVLAQKYDLLIVEDAAQTIGGRMGGKTVGSFGVGCFSFFPSKNMTTGEGGMITLNSSSLAGKVRSLISHGINRDSSRVRMAPWHRVATQVGYNFRLNNILAAIGISQLAKLEIMNDKRRTAAKAYDEILAQSKFIQIPHAKENFHHVYQMYIIIIDSQFDRDSVVLELRARGIEASVHFDPLLHSQNIYSNGEKFHLPNAEFVSQHCISLPIYPDIDEYQIKYVTNNLLEILADLI